MALTIDQQQLDSSTLETSVQGTGGTPASTENAGQSWTTGAGITRLDKVDVWMFKVGTPTGNLQMDIYAVSTDSPTGASLGTSSVVSVATLTTSTSGALVSFTFATPITGLSGKTKYVWVISLPSAGSNDTNYARIMGSNLSAYGAGKAGDVFNPPNTWTVRTYDMYFKTYYDSAILGNPSISYNLVAYWKLDESSGDATDAAGNTTLTNVGTMTYSSGRIRNGAVIATGKYLQVTDANQSGLGISGDMTISAWVNFTNLTGFQNITSKFDGTSQEAYETYWTGTAFGIELNQTGGGTTHFVEITYAAAINTWYHVVCVYTASTHTAQVYVNGVLIGSGDITWNSIAITTAPFDVGARNAGSNIFKGSIDEVGVWARALTQAEVTTLYRGGSGLQYPFITPSFKENKLRPAIFKPGTAK